ncbi:hypothetical protein [Nisaea nitritireducens]|uniref:hypothetical protein n=1 Tax=Nisaea nitritireducens TaxID=568392 RepID=UPI001865E0ED|nr:hypothetical protein [Nisaea nitritireducens]
MNPDRILGKDTRKTLLCGEWGLGVGGALYAVAPPKQTMIAVEPEDGAIRLSVGGEKGGGFGLPPGAARHIGKLLTEAADHMEADGK